MMVIGILGIVLVLILFYGIGTYNAFVRRKNIVKEAFSTMDVYLKKRWDLIPNLIETVKGYAKHEKELLENIVNLRNTSYDSMSTTEKLDANTQLSGAIGRLIAVAEAYPDLKANQNFLNLSNQLTGIENDIANSRKYYNGAVRELNTKIEMFPSNIIAGMFGFQPDKMFETSEKERENIKVEF